MKKFISLFVVTALVVSCTNSHLTSPTSKTAASDQIQSLNSEYKKLLRDIYFSDNGALSLSDAEMVKITGFEKRFSSFIANHPNLNLQPMQRAIHEHQTGINDFSDFLDHLKQIGSTPEFIALIHNIIENNGLGTIQESNILNHERLTDREKLTVLLANTFLTYNHLSAPDYFILRGGRTCAEQLRIDERRCNRNALIGLVGSALLAPLTGGAGTAVGVGSTIVYHVSCIGDAREDYRDCMR